MNKKKGGKLSPSFLFVQIVCKNANMMIFCIQYFTVLACIYENTLKLQANFNLLAVQYVKRLPTHFSQNKQSFFKKQLH